jgi:hypothetical protein
VSSIVHEQVERYNLHNRSFAASIALALGTEETSIAPLDERVHSSIDDFLAVRIRVVAPVEHRIAVAIARSAPARKPSG